MFEQSFILIKHLSMQPLSQQIILYQSSHQVVFIASPASVMSHRHTVIQEFFCAKNFHVINFQLDLIFMDQVYPQKYTFITILATNIANNKVLLYLPFTMLQIMQPTYSIRSCDLLDLSRQCRQTPLFMQEHYHFHYKHTT